jgi:hypothetical protein
LFFWCAGDAERALPTLKRAANGRRASGSRQPAQQLQATQRAALPDGLLARSSQPERCAPIDTQTAYCSDDDAADSPMVLRPAARAAAAARDAPRSEPMRDASPGGFSPLPPGPCHLLPTVANTATGLPSISSQVRHSSSGLASHAHPRPLHVLRCAAAAATCPLQTLAALLSQGAASFGASGAVVIDCRYDYEFEGGHIAGALNLPTPAQLFALLQGGGHDWARTPVVLLCEFSSERAPRAFRHVRQCDRQAHLADYPALAWPQLFLLEGGYRAFVAAAPQLCEPVGAHVAMDHEAHTAQLRACHRRVTAAWAQALGAPPPPARPARPRYSAARQP